VDFHAEATSEKLAMGWFLDGRVSAVFGTHTHVQTADERILPKGTAYITDVGMTGPKDSVLGVRPDIVISKFLSQMPARFELVRNGDSQFNGIWMRVDDDTGQVLEITRVNESDKIL
jgi:metallophosphoesterase (TIGR00282 family)